MHNATLQNTASASKPRTIRHVGLLLLSLAFPLYAADSASAKDESPADKCMKKYHQCQGRCAKNNPTDWTPCINRTCNRQYDNCIAAIKKDESSRPTAGNQNAPPQPPPHRPRGNPLSDGSLLDTTPTNPMPGRPASTGTLAPATPRPAPQIR